MFLFWMIMTILQRNLWIFLWAWILYDSLRTLQDTLEIDTHSPHIRLIWTKSNSWLLSQLHWWKPLHLRQSFFQLFLRSKLRNKRYASCRKNYYKEGNFIYPKFDAVEAYRKALTTWANWIKHNVKPSKQLVFYRGYSSAHFRYSFCWQFAASKFSSKHCPSASRYREHWLINSWSHPSFLAPNYPGESVILPRRRNWHTIIIIEAAAENPNCSPNQMLYLTFYLSDLKSVHLISMTYQYLSQ